MRGGGGEVISNLLLRLGYDAIQVIWRVHRKRATGVGEGLEFWPQFLKSLEGRGVSLQRQAGKLSFKLGQLSFVAFGKRGIHFSISAGILADDLPDDSVSHLAGLQLVNSSLSHDLIEGFDFF